MDAPDGQDDRSARESAELDISPSVRRLLRQYDLDARTIKGTGPNGRIRPGDVLALVGNPAQLANGESSERGKASPTGGARTATESAKRIAPARGENGAVGTTLFACNMSRVLADRARAGVDAASIACYVAHAAIRRLDRLGAGITAARFVLSGADDRAEAVLTPANSGTPAAVQIALTEARPARDRCPALRILHHGLPGHVVDLIPPAADDELAVLSIGGLQRGIGLAIADGAESPRVVAQCQLALSYRADAIDATAAARFVGDCVRALESWPPAQTAAAGAD